MLAGGGALLHGLDARLEHETGMPIVIAAQPAALRGHRLGPVARGVRGAEGRAVLVELAELDAAPRSWPSPGAPVDRASPCSLLVLDVDHAAHARLPRHRARRRRCATARPRCSTRCGRRGRRRVRPGRQRLERRLRLRRPEEGERAASAPDRRARGREAIGDEVARAARSPTRSRSCGLKLTSARSRPSPAEVVSGPLTSFDATIEIDRGSGDGVKEGMAVVTAAGLVGRVVRVTGGRVRRAASSPIRRSASGCSSPGWAIAASRRGQVANGDPRVNEGIDEDTPCAEATTSSPPPRLEDSPSRRRSRWAGSTGCGVTDDRTEQTLVIEPVADLRGPCPS